MILGVSLVVDELNKGPRLVFSYPDQASTYHRRNVPGISIRDLQFHDINKEHQRNAAFVDKLYNQYFKLCQDNFAKLFVVKGSLVGKSFELAMDDLHFISFPCFTTSTKEPAEERSEAGPGEERDKDLLVKDATAKDVAGSRERERDKGGEVLTMFNIVIATISGQAMLKINKNFLYKCQCKYLSHCGEDPIAAALGLRLYTYGICRQSLRRVLEAATNSLLALERRDRYVSREVAKMIGVLERGVVDDEESAVAPGAQTLTAVVSFTRMRRSCSNESARSSCSERSYSVATQLSDGDAVSLLEQASSLSLRSTSASFSATAPAVSAAPTGSAAPPSSCQSVKFEGSWPGELQGLLMQHSSLANELRMLFHNLTGGHSANLQFNGSKAVNVTLACKERRLCADSRANQPCVCAGESFFGSAIVGVPPAAALSNTSAARQLSDGRGGSKGISPSMQTMLTLAEPESIVQILSMLDGRSMFHGHSAASANTALKQGRLYTFIEAADPTRSFFDLSVLLDEPVEELVNMATYLQGWGLAEIIPVIYTHSCYKVHMHAPLHPHSRVANAFDRLLLSLHATTNGAVTAGGSAAPSVGAGAGTAGDPLAKASQPRHRVPIGRRTGSLDFASPTINPTGRGMTRSAGPLSSNSHLPASVSGGTSAKSTGRGVTPEAGAPVVSALRSPIAFPFRERVRRNSAELSSEPHVRRHSIDLTDVPGPPQALPGDSSGADRSPPPPAAFSYFSQSPPQSHQLRHWPRSLSLTPPAHAAPIAPPQVGAVTTPAGLGGPDKVDWKLVRVLGLFDGLRPLGEVLQLLPGHLKDFGLDMVVFLLRWHMLVNVDAYLVNLLAMPLPGRELTLLLQQQVQVQAPAATGLTRSEDSKPATCEAQAVAPASFWQSIMRTEVELTLLQNPWVDRLSAAELQTLEKIAPFLQASAQTSTGIRCSAAQNTPQATSFKALPEVLFLTRLRETDLMLLLEKLPFLKILRKITHPYA